MDITNDAGAIVFLSSRNFRRPSLNTEDKISITPFDRFLHQYQLNVELGLAVATAIRPNPLQNYIIFIKNKNNLRICFEFISELFESCFRVDFLSHFAGNSELFPKNKEDKIPKTGSKRLKPINNIEIIILQ